MGVEQIFGNVIKTFWWYKISASKFLEVPAHAGENEKDLQMEPCFKEQSSQRKDLVTKNFSNFAVEEDVN